jgi:hypothetical protein
VTLNKSRVSQLISHAKTIAALPISTTVNTERTLRPLNSTLNQAKTQWLARGDDYHRVRAP